ncbi:hypothetical protein PoB_000119900 [Plakobranchus ocellatus]|uniref:Uncharacterized protein n=1 Tax=Plakobranchus ocellatus TaxID=259542 RepID=A0AAV3XY58_9GAST|nr:hypothetical protein PoB_000119900 [Plakobranchus ocellatus]
MTKRVCSRQNRHFRSPPDGASDDQVKANAWGPYSNASKVADDDGCFSTWFDKCQDHDRLNEPFQDNSEKSRRLSQTESLKQRELSASKSCMRSYSQPPSSASQIRASGKILRIPETKFRSFGTDPKTPDIDRRASGSLAKSFAGDRTVQRYHQGDHDTSKDLVQTFRESEDNRSREHMGALQTVLRSPKGEEFTPSTAESSRSVNGRPRGKDDTPKIPQPPFPSSSEVQPRFENERSWYENYSTLDETKAVIGDNNNSHIFRFEENTTNSLDNISNEFTQGLYYKIDKEKGIKTMLRDTAVQTSLELEGYAVDISSSLEDLNSSVESETHENQATCGANENGASGDHGHRRDIDKAGVKAKLSHSQLRAQPINSGVVNEGFEASSACQRDPACWPAIFAQGGKVELQRHDVNESFAYRGSGKHESWVKASGYNGRPSTYAKTQVVRSNSFHSDTTRASRDCIEINDSNLNDKEAMLPIRRPHRAAAEGVESVLSRSSCSGGGGTLSGSLHELRHLNIDVSQRLVDGEKKYFVVNGGSPDLQVVVNSSTPVLSRRRNKSGGGRRVATGHHNEMNRHHIDNYQLPSNMSSVTEGTPSSMIFPDMTSNQYPIHVAPNPDRSKRTNEMNVPENIINEGLQGFKCVDDDNTLLPVYVRLRSHDGSVQCPGSDDPNSPRKLTDDDFTSQQHKKKGIYQVSEELIMMSKQIKEVDCVKSELTHQPSKAMSSGSKGKTHVFFDKHQTFPEDREAVRDNVLSLLPPGMDDLTEELEKSRQSLFLSPKLAHTWHGASTEHGPPSQRPAPRMGLGVYFQDAAARGLLPFTASGGKKSGEKRLASAENKHKKEKDNASSRRHPGGLTGFYHGHTLPVISRTLLDAMHKRYCAHQYSPSMLQHLQPCSALTIPPSSSPTTTTAVSGSYTSFRQAPVATALRVEPPVNARHHEVHAAPPSPQVMARLRQMLQQQQQQKQQQQQQHQHSQQKQQPDVIPMTVDNQSLELNMRKFSSSELEPHEKRTAVLKGNRTHLTLRDIPSLPPHIKSRLLAAAQHQVQNANNLRGDHHHHHHHHHHHYPHHHQQQQYLTENRSDNTSNVTTRIQSAYRQKAGKSNKTNGAVA